MKLKAIKSKKMPRVAAATGVYPKGRTSIFRELAGVSPRRPRVERVNRLTLTVDTRTFSETQAELATVDVGRTSRF